MWKPALEKDAAALALLPSVVPTNLTALQCLTYLGERLIAGEGLGEEGNIEMGQPVLRQYLGCVT